VIVTPIRLSTAAVRANIIDIEVTTLNVFESI